MPPIEIGADWAAIQGNDDELAELAGEDEDVADAERILATSGWTEIGARGRAARTDIRDRRPQTARFIDLPFPVVTVPAAGTADAVAEPQETFRPQRLTLDPTAGIAVDLIIIGKKVQFASVVGSVPAAVYQNTALGAQRHYDTAQISQQVLIRLRNLTAAPIDVSSAFSGPAVD